MRDVVSVTPFLWFDDNAEAAMNFYAKTFAHSEIVTVNRMDMPTAPGVDFIIGTIRIEDLTFTIMNGGPAHQLTEAFSLVVTCEDQLEVDYYWLALGTGGEPGPCGWLKDQFGLSWQIIPTMLIELLSDPDPEKSGRVRDAMLIMSKIECDKLQAAYDA
jgi:predicted 3-demethylubiquinone-9 3-methyltransferase (glyoxalase superfamily)